MEIEKKIILLLLFGLCNILPAKHIPSQSLVINEIKTHGTHSQYDEFIELFNVSDAPISVGGNILTYYNSDGQPTRILHTFPDSLTLQPYQYYLLTSENCTENNTPDACFAHGLFSNGQLILTDSVGLDTIDAVSWGHISQNVSHEGEPVPFIESSGGPPVSPELHNSTIYVLHRTREGIDTNHNREDFSVFSFTTPMNSNDTLTVIMAQSLNASINPHQNIVLQWKTVLSTKNIQFDVFFKEDSLSEFQIIPTADELIHVSQNDTNIFEYVLPPFDTKKTYSAKIRETDFRNRPNFSKTIKISPNKIATPQKVEYFHLKQNFPNPFNPNTKIQYTILLDSEIDLSIYNVNGQKIRRLVSGMKPAGDYEITWDGSDDNHKQVTSGEYFAVIQANESSRNTIKMVFFK